MWFIHTGTHHLTLVGFLGWLGLGEGIVFGVWVCVLLVFQDSVSTLLVFKLSIGSLGIISKDTWKSMWKMGPGHACNPNTQGIGGRSIRNSVQDHYLSFIGSLGSVWATWDHLKANNNKTPQLLWKKGFCFFSSQSVFAEHRTLVFQICCFSFQQIICTCLNEIKVLQGYILCVEWHRDILEEVCSWVVSFESQECFICFRITPPTNWPRLLPSFQGR